MKKQILLGIAVCLLAGISVFTACGKDDDKKEEKNKKNIPAGYVDLGLPSGTKWKAENEEGFYTLEKAIEKFGDKLPTDQQLYELYNKCKWFWHSSPKGYNVIGPNGNSIFLPAAGFRWCSGEEIGEGGIYRSSERGVNLYFFPDPLAGAYKIGLDYDSVCWQSVRLVTK